MPMREIERWQAGGMPSATELNRLSMAAETLSNRQTAPGIVSDVTGVHQLAPDQQWTWAKITSRREPITLSITGATNASPIVITTASNHNLETGDIVKIAEVGGNTAANGVWTVTDVSDTTFSLDGSTGNAAYTSGGYAYRRTSYAWTEQQMIGGIQTDKPGGFAGTTTYYPLYEANDAYLDVDTIVMAFVGDGQFFECVKPAPGEIFAQLTAVLVGSGSASSISSGGGGSCRSYAWTQKEHDGNCGWQTVDDGLTGTTWFNSAFEANNQLATVGSIVRLRPGHVGYFGDPPRLQQQWIFFLV